MVSQMIVRLWGYGAVGLWSPAPHRKLAPRTPHPSEKRCVPVFALLELPRCNRVRAEANQCAGWLQILSRANERLSDNAKGGSSIPKQKRRGRSPAFRFPCSLVLSGHQFDRAAKARQRNTRSTVAGVETQFFPRSVLAGPFRLGSEVVLDRTRKSAEVV